MSRRLKRTEPLKFYKPNPKQVLFHKSPMRKRWLIAANRAGKTEAGVIEDIWWATGKHPYREVPPISAGWVCSETFQVQIADNGIQEKFQKYFPRERIGKITRREQDAWGRISLTCFFCGKPPVEKRDDADPMGSASWCQNCNKKTSTITMKTYDQDRRVFQAAEVDWIHWDEEPPKGIRKEGVVRLSKRGGGWEWGTMTPVEGMTWTITEIYDLFYALQNAGAPHPELDVIQASMYDNVPNISLEYIESTKAAIADPAEIDIRIYGKPSTLSGLIYKGWTVEGNEVRTMPKEFLADDGQIHPDFDVYVGIDTGTYFAAVWVLSDYMGNLWIFDEYEKERGTIMQNAPEVKRKSLGWGVSPTYVLDKSSQFEYELAELGIHCVKSLPYEVEAGVEIMRNYIVARGSKGGHPRLFVVAGKCPGWLKQRSRYQYENPTRTGPVAGEARTKPRKVDDHLLDPTRYIAQMRPPASRPSPGRDSRSLHARTLDKVKKEIKDSREPSDEDIYKDI
jgi:phage terminase large subunit-like protein